MDLRATPQRHAQALYVEYAEKLVKLEEEIAALFVVPASAGIMQQEGLFVVPPSGGKARKRKIPPEGGTTNMLAKEVVKKIEQLEKQRARATANRVYCSLSERELSSAISLSLALHSQRAWTSNFSYGRFNWSPASTR